MPNPPATSAVALPRLSDRALFARAAVDEAAFAEIVNRYREPLRRHAARYVGDADAEDVVQQALVNASLALRREPERDIEPKPWLYKVTTNAAIDHRRAQSVRPLGDRPHEEIDLDAVRQSPNSDPHEVVTGRESVRSMVSGIQGLAPNQRRAATARFLEGRSHDEIASELGVSKGAARELIHRAKRNLREAIPALSPLPLFAKLRESIAALFAGSSAPAAKLAAAGVAVVAAAGAGGIAIKSAQDGGDAKSPAAKAPAAAPAAAVTEVSRVAERPRPGNGANGGQDGGRDSGGGRDGGGDSAGSGGASGGGEAASAGTPTSGATPAAGGTAGAADAGGSSNPVQDAADQLGVGEVTDQLGVDEATGPVGEVTDQLGVDVPGLPNVGETLGGGN